MQTSNEDPKNFLQRHNFEFRETNGEYVFPCPFNTCDDDSRPNEAHCYMSADTGQYHCKKCNETGNLISLAKFLNDEPPELAKPRSTPTRSPRKKSPPKLSLELVEKCASTIPTAIREYLNHRGISDEQIAAHKIGFGEFYGRNWITLPVMDAEGSWNFFKLRRDPSDGNNPDKYKFFPVGSGAALYNGYSLVGNEDYAFICEGELDALISESQGIPAITSTAGAATFKDEWLDSLSELQSIYVCFDTDEAGQRATGTLTDKLAQRFPEIAIFETRLPERMTEGKDLTDYFTNYDGTREELMDQLSKQVAGPPPVDPSLFVPLTMDAVMETLNLTIKNDRENKAATFLCQLVAYTEGSQFNISFNAPSSTGKSYIPTEIAKLFPVQDVKEIGYCSPTAFFHDSGVWDEKRKVMVVDLSRRILIFLDQPHTMLLEHLRPLLSHDKKEISLKITDKTQKHGLKTKTVILKGYPSVIFCTAGLNLDEQEATRFLLLSPEVNQDKIRQGIKATVLREADADNYATWLNEDPGRSLLADRIRAIKREHIEEIKLANFEEIERRFLATRPLLKPRHQRDVKRLIALIKGCALLNLWWRNRDGSTITASDADIEEGFCIWDEISASQELNLPPYLYNLFNDVIVSAWNELNGEVALEIGISVGITRQHILRKHMEVYGRPLSTIQLRQEMIPMLESAGLIVQEQSPTDKREKLIFPVLPSADQNNSEADGGVANNTGDTDNEASSEIMTGV